MEDPNRGLGGVAMCSSPLVFCAFAYGGVGVVRAVCVVRVYCTSCAPQQGGRGGVREIVTSELGQLEEVTR